MNKGPIVSDVNDWQVRDDRVLPLILTGVKNFACEETICHNITSGLAEKTLSWGVQGGQFMSYSHHFSLPIIAAAARLSWKAGGCVRACRWPVSPPLSKVRLM